MNFHEDLDRSVAKKQSSDRQFGLVAGTLMALAGWRAHRHFALMCSFQAIAALILLAALLVPRVLSFANRAWFHLGEFLGKVTNPVFLTLTYLILFIPAGLILRLAGKDPLHMRIDKTMASYWIEKPQGELPSESMRHLF